MFAIIRTGGKQYKVKVNDIIKIEKLGTEKGAFVSLDHVLLINDGKKNLLGSPQVEGATVQAEVLDHIKDEKIIVFKKKRRQNYRRKKGHRQIQTIIKISGIYTDGKAPSLSDAGKAAADKVKKTPGKKKAEKAAPEKKAASKKVAEKKTAAKKETAAKKSSKKPVEKKTPATKKTETKKKPASKSKA